MRNTLRLLALATLVCSASGTLAATPASLAVTPDDAIIPVNSAQRFATTATFRDGNSRLVSNRTLAVGSGHVCAVTLGGPARCWGFGTNGQLGNGANDPAPYPVTTGILETVTAITAGGSGTCAVSNGAAWCWGAGTLGQLGNGTTDDSNLPVQVAMVGPVIALSAGPVHRCAVRGSGSGTVSCWGVNLYGQLGNGTNTASNLPVTVTGITNAVDVGAGQGHSCALLDTGIVRCWGGNDFGQLGNGTAVPSNVPVTVTGLANVVALSVGHHHNCALIAGGEIRCWGNGGSGRLGDGNADSEAVPVATLAPPGANAVSAGQEHSCALYPAGNMLCWGDNSYGQLGDGSGSDMALTPVAVIHMGQYERAIAISAGSLNTCAMEADGSTWCWGDGTALGSNTTLVQTSTPQHVTGLSVGVSAGGDHTCAVGWSGQVSCWGLHVNSRLGQDHGGVGGLPAVVTGLWRASEVAASNSHSCARDLEYRVWCWGENGWGQGGTGSIEPFALTTAVQVVGLEQVAQISVGGLHSCAVMGDTTVKCWGRNFEGQLGVANLNYTATPVTVTGLSNVAEVAAGGSHTCARRYNGTIACWGLGIEGQLGQWATESSNVPVEVVDINNAARIAAGEMHTCAVLIDLTVRCWGMGAAGQLGHGFNARASRPEAVLGLDNAIGIAAGAQHSCALTNLSGIVCWGRGDFGQLGNLNTQNFNTPQAVFGLTSATSDLEAGAHHTCVLVQGQTIRCWGNNLRGQLGIAGPVYAANPVFPTTVSLEGVALDLTSADPEAMPAQSGSVFMSQIGSADITARYGNAVTTVTLEAAADTDADGRANPRDNCTLHANPDQYDSNSDGYGNRCDGDLNNNLATNAPDLVLFRAAFGSANADADLNHSGSVNAADLVIFRSLFGQPPGPSGLVP